MIGERITERLKGAMAPETLTVAEPARAAAEDAAAQSSAEPQATTTMEELEGLHAVRSIVRDMVSSKRTVMRDAQSYCGILLDDNNRKPVCRLRFNNAHRLRLGPFNDKRKEEQLSLDEVDDIHNCALRCGRQARQRLQE